MPLPGLALLALTGALAWLLAGAISPRLVCAVIVVPAIAGLTLLSLRHDTSELLGPGERPVLALVSGVIAIAVGKALWSLGPAGELFAGLSSRTLEVGDRSDSALSFGIVRLIAHGTSPYGRLARGYFGGYTFSDRGPLAGLASAPVVMISGGRPPSGAVGQWAPFDADGFMAYRLAMMTFAGTAFLSVWSLARRVAGPRAGWLALILAVTTPFLVHEVWFTWPKLLAASLVLLAGIAILDGRPGAGGLLAGTGYLVHPVALLALPALLAVALWPDAAPRWRHPRYGPAGRVLLGAAAGVLAWRIVNLHHYTQGNFLKYLTKPGRNQAFTNQLLARLGGHPHAATVGDWIRDRLVSLANTLVPLRLPLLSAHDPSINAANGHCTPFCGHTSPASIHVLFQYWTSVPFGLAIVFLPMLLAGLWRAGRRWPWAVTAVIVAPFVVFAIYWGDASTGLLREGLQAWVLALVVVLAAEQCAEGFAWGRSRIARGVLALRAGEMLLLAVLPVVLTRHRLISSSYRLSDTVAVSMIAVAAAAFAAAAWRFRPA